MSTFNVCGISYASPLAVSALLRQMGLTHTYLGEPVNLERLPETSIHIVKNHFCIGKEGVYLYFTCDEELSETNIPRAKPSPITTQWIQTLFDYANDNPMTGWRYQRTKKTMMQYVEVATKPSYLNKVQEAIYKINPYNLRKEAQAKILRHIAGHISDAEILTYIRSSPRFAVLESLIAQPEKMSLRSALKSYKAGERDETLLAKRWGVETFEILYLANSPIVNS